MIGTCSNCKFWQKKNSDNEIEYDTEGFSICKNIRHNNHRIGYEFNLDMDRLQGEYGGGRYNGLSKEEAEQYVKEIREYQTNTKAATQDYENYHSWLITRHDFGCILYEKENE